MSGINRAAEKMKLSFNDYEVPVSESKTSKKRGRVDRLIPGTQNTYYLNLDKRDLQLLNELHGARKANEECVSRSDILSEALYLLYLQDLHLEEQYQEEAEEKTR